MHGLRPKDVSLNVGEGRVLPEISILMLSLLMLYPLLEATTNLAVTGSKFGPVSSPFDRVIGEGGLPLNAVLLDGVRQCLARTLILVVYVDNDIVVNGRVVLARVDMVRTTARFYSMGKLNLGLNIGRSRLLTALAARAQPVGKLCPSWTAKRVGLR